MACKKCNGYYQCSPSGDPCDLAAGDPIETETACLYVFVKEVGGDSCNMKIQCTDNVPAGWTLAGKMCFDVDLYRSGDPAQCWVRITGPNPS